MACDAEKCFHLMTSSCCGQYYGTRKSITDGIKIANSVYVKTFNESCQFSSSKEMLLMHHITRVGAVYQSVCWIPWRKNICLLYLISAIESVIKQGGHHRNENIDLYHTIRSYFCWGHVDRSSCIIDLVLSLNYSSPKLKWVLRKKC